MRNHNEVDMSDVESVNKIKEQLLKLCDGIEGLGKYGIRIEFKIENGRLVEFRALKEMKLSS